MAVCRICIFNLLQIFVIERMFSINEHLQKITFSGEGMWVLVTHKLLFFVDIKCGLSDVRYNCGFCGCADKKWSSINIHTPLPVQCRLSLVSNELSNGQYNTTSIGCAFLTFCNVVIWATAVCLPPVAKHLQNDISEFFKIRRLFVCWRSILKIAIKCTTLFKINVPAPLELLSGALPFGNWEWFVLGERGHW